MGPRAPSYAPVVGYTPVRQPERPKGCQRCCCGCAAVGFVLSLVFFGVALGLALMRPRVNPDLRDRQTQAQQRWKGADSSTTRETAERAVERASTVRHQVAEQAARGGTAPFEVTVTEDEVNAILASDARIRESLAKQGVSGVTVLFEEDRMLCSGRVERGGLGFDVTATAVPVVRPDGTLDVRIESARAGRFRVPTALVDEARSALAQVLAKQDPERGRIDEVRLTRGLLTVRGHAEGSANAR